MSLPKERVHPSVVNLPYIQRSILVLSIFGGWPYEVLGEEKWFTKLTRNKIIYMINFIATILQAMFLLKYYGVTVDLVEACALSTNVLMGMLYIQRVATTWTYMYKTVTRDFMNKINLHHHKHLSSYATKIATDVDKISDIYSKLLSYEASIGLIAMNFVTLVKLLANGVFNKQLNGTIEDVNICRYDLPSDVQNSLSGLLAVYAFNVFHSVSIAACLSSSEVFISVIIFQLWGHIKLLKHNLNNIPKPKMKKNSNSMTNVQMYDEEESRNITKLLISSMKHYELIKAYKNDVSTAFGLSVCFGYLYHLTMQCTLLIQLSQMKAESFLIFGILTITSFQQLIQISLVFELISSQSETIRDAVYGVPWESMNINNRRIVSVYLYNTIEPLQFKGLGILPIGVQTMASILKTSFSYFMLLRASATDQN